MTKALLLIDLQRDYFPGGQMPLTGIEPVSERAAHLLEEFRERGLPLIHIRHVFADDAAPFFRPDTSGIEIHTSVAPRGDEIVITKQHVNAFQHTDLKARLDSIGVDDLVVCGAMSHMCVEGTTRAASDLGYRCQVVHDACATRDQEFGGRVISAEDVHGAAMSALSFAYADVVSLDQWLRSQN